MNIKQRENSQESMSHEIDGQSFHLQKFRIDSELRREAGAGVRERGSAGPLIYSILYTLYSILYALYSILYTLYSIFYILYSIFYTLYSIFYILYSIFYILYYSVFCMNHYSTSIAHNRSYHSSITFSLLTK